LIIKGCEFIARIFDPTLTTAIQVLTLDYNRFGNAGFFQLAAGLKTARTLNYLSLAYCDIDEDGIKHIGEYLGSSTCKLETLILQGNPLKNAGVNVLFQALFSNNSLEELNLNNTLFGNDDDTISNLVGLMEADLFLKSYLFKFNFITDESNICKFNLKTLKEY